MTAKTQTIREQIALQALEHAALDGWNNGALGLAAEDLGHDHSMAEILFPEGESEAIDLICQHFDGLMVNDFMAKHKNEKSITKRIELMIMCRLQAYEDYKKGVENTILHLMKPQNAVSGQKHLWRTLDIIWNIAGKDVTTDYNYYTKRGLLEFAYLQTIRFWHHDESENLVETQSFLREKLQSIVKTATKAKNLFGKLSSFKIPKFR
jgi:ubiquinone biosynthesis protein COQ9